MVEGKDKTHIKLKLLGMRRFLIILFCLFILTTCGPQVKFVQPQPKDGKNLTRIPREYYGQYSCNTDSSILVIDSTSVVSYWISEEIVPRDSIVEIERDLKLAIKRDTQIYVSEKRENWLSNGLYLDIKFKGDSVKVNVKAENRMFEISDSQLVRKYRGYCFLNTKTTDGIWLVKVLHLKGTALNFDDLLDTEQVKKLKGVTRVAGPIDTLKNEPKEYYLNPTRRELRRILRNRNVNYDYIKVK